MMLLAHVLLASVFAGAAAKSQPPSTNSVEAEGGEDTNFVKGRVFDRFVTVWLENTDFDVALADPSISALALQGLELKNYFAITHPSEPNYISTVGGEYFGMNNDAFSRVPANVSTVVDLLEAKGISWASYQEDMPLTGFQGFQFLNPATGANDYVRKHNPLIIYDSVANSMTRSSNIKNFTLFHEDLANGNLPQWVFITPNMTNDGHDTNVTVAGAFAKNFLEPLLANPKFNSRTLVLLTFDENENGLQPNRVRTILLGDTVPKSLVGTVDNNFYDHYSEISTVEANWHLHTLGRYDVGANVFALVGNKTGDTIRTLANPPLSQTFLNGSYPGLFNSLTTAPMPIPNTSLVVNNRKVLPQIVATWGSHELQKCTVYTGALEIPSASHPPVLPAGC